MGHAHRFTRVLPRKLRLLLPLILVAIASLPFVAAAQGPAETEGQTLFQQKCAGCHTIGGGDTVGPDLKGVTELRDHDWLMRWLADPPGMVASGDPVAKELLSQYNNVQMPKLGLSDTEIENLLVYLGSSTGTSTPPTSALPQGNPALGKDYFTGQRRFANGGPPCMACHSISGIGALGGGRLGPDLSGAYNTWGDSGLTAFVTNPPTVTMNTVWTQTPLTPEEGSDLIAFIKQASVSQRPANTVAQLTLLAVGSALVLLLIAQVIWRKRLRGVRKQMVANVRRG